MGPCVRRGDERWQLAARKPACQYLSNGLNALPKKTITRERDVAELKRESGVSKALNAAWVRPFLFLLFIVVAWDLTIRLFQIPAYQIPAPGDVVAVLRTEWPGLLRQARAATYATTSRLPLSGPFRVSRAALFSGSS